jgi:hypothetical protein
MTGASLPRNPWLLLVLASAGAVHPPHTAAAQNWTPTVIEGLRPVGSTPSPRARIAMLEQRLSVQPMDYDLRWRAAREYSLLGTTETHLEKKVHSWTRARLHASAATTLSPDSLDGRYWLAAASGLLADVSGGRTKVRMADHAFREAAWVVSADSTHAGAHYLLGPLHASVMRLGGFTRFVAKTLLGGDLLGEASWERAEFHLHRASELDPGSVMHHVELALVYRDTGQPERMEGVLSTALEVPGVGPLDKTYRALAVQLLALIRGEG